MKKHRVLVINLIYCAVIGATFGFLSGNLLPWLLAGAAIGALIGLVAEALFKGMGIPPHRHLRGLLLILLVEALVVLYFVVPAYNAWFTVHPARTAISLTPASAGLAYEEVSLMTRDGLRLKAWSIPSRNGAAVIAVHGHSGNRSHTLLHARALAEAGYGVLAFDMRAHGESEGAKFATGWDSDLDVLAAVEYLETRADVEPGRIGALGLSAGATAVIYAAASTERIQAIVADGTPLGATADTLQPILPELRPFFFMTPANWVEQEMIERFSGYPGARPIKEHVPLIAPRPILFIAAGNDWLESAVARRYHSLASPQAKIWIVPGANHLEGIATYPEEYAARLRSFFDAHLPADREVRNGL
ncbi:MAG: alpha/beta fold hydrolase [Anaerolineae bacterium]|nr:alpha/beta fold hydrolase [Anaerolineae bacterium]